MVQFHLHSANFMYISEYYEMIMLCNQGETGVLGGAPGHPRLLSHSSRLAMGRCHRPGSDGRLPQHQGHEEPSSGMHSSVWLLPEHSPASPAGPGFTQQLLEVPAVPGHTCRVLGGSPGTALPPGTPQRGRAGAHSAGCRSQQCVVPRGHQKVVTGGPQGKSQAGEPRDVLEVT